QLPERSLHFLIEAAEQSSRMAADTEALELLEEAAASQWNVGDANLGQRARIEWQLGEVHFRRGDHERARRHLVQAIDLLGDPVPNGHFRVFFQISREFIVYAVNIVRGLANRR